MPCSNPRTRRRPLLLVLALVGTAVTACTPKATPHVPGEEIGGERDPAMAKKVETLEKKLKRLEAHLRTSSKWQGAVHEGLSNTHTELGLLRSTVMRLFHFHKLACSHFSAQRRLTKKQLQAAGLEKMKAKLNKMKKGRKRRRLKKRVSAVEKRLAPLQEKLERLKKLVQACRLPPPEKPLPGGTRPPGADPPPAPPAPLPGMDNEEQRKGKHRNPPEA